MERESFDSVSAGVLPQDWLLPYAWYPTRTWCQSDTGEHRLHKESEIKERGWSVESTGDDARLSCEVKAAMPREVVNCEAVARD